ncbi:hypothetical protein H3T55_08570 [Enterococcus sp. S22(2020)]|nr:hypothetical protein [Enterococcus sp. S23]MCA5016302.1 hypothetical protein [Enterococcus sp. S22(2020)]
MDQIKQLLPVSSERVQHLREASGLISEYTSAKRKLEKQLQKLLAFHAFSSTLFTEVTSLQAAVNQGLTQVSGGKGFDPKTGTFSPKNLKDTRWMITIGNAWEKREKEIAEINRKARVEREMAALQEAAKIAGADIAMNSFMMNVGLMNMGPSIYGNLKDYGSQKALTASLRPTGTMSRSNMKVSGGELPQKYQQIIKKNSSDYNYSRSVLEKAKLDPHYHDFPKNLDNEILSNPVLTRPDGRIEHLAKGTINGEKGIYHITLKGDKIIHRTFIPESGWARFAKVNGLPEYVNIPSLK